MVMNFIKKVFGGSAASDNNQAERLVSAVEQIAENTTPADAGSALAAAASAEAPTAVVQWSSVSVETEAKGGLKITPAGQSIYLSAEEATQYAGQPLKMVIQSVSRTRNLGVDVNKLTSFLVNGVMVDATTPLPAIPTQGAPVRVAASAPAGNLG